MKTSTFVTHLLSLFLGSSLLYAHQAFEAVVTAQNKAQKAEASAREAYQKLYDLQESTQEAADAAFSEQSVLLWNTQMALDKCQQGKK